MFSTLKNNSSSVLELIDINAIKVSRIGHSPICNNMPTCFPRTTKNNGVMRKKLLSCSSRDELFKTYRKFPKTLSQIVFN